MTVYIKKIIGSSERFGTFKSRFYDYAKESGAKDITRIGFSSGGPKLFLDNREFSFSNDVLLVLNNSNMKQLKFLFGLPNVKIVNPPQYREINKLDVWQAAVSNKISTPDITVSGTPVTMEHAVLKPIRGEGGIGIRLLRFGESIPPDYMAQKLILSPNNLKATFDIRVYVLCGKFLGSTMRITTKTKEVVGGLFGLSNTHQ